MSEAGGFVCDTGSAGGPLPDASPDAEPGLMYQATVAECVDPTLPNPDKCRSVKGPDQLCVDLKDSTTTHPWHAFVRFDLDAAFSATSVAALTLELTATDDGTAPSPSSGMVWQVQPFAKADLYVAEPKQIGTTSIAPAQGAVVKDEVVRWALPTNLATPGGSVFLELTTTSGDGVNYWNLDGTHPPRLVVVVP